MTIKEIAQLAGVSSAAVSRYLNGGYISEEKKEKIRKVVEETGYQPSAQARMLRPKRACPGGCGGAEDQFRVHQPRDSRDRAGGFHEEDIRCFSPARTTNRGRKSRI